MTGTMHKTMVARIIAQTPGAKTHGWHNAAKRLIASARGRPVDDECWREEVRPYLSMIPDAYTADEPENTLTMYEVDVTHGLNDARLARYMSAWFTQDCEGVWFRLICVDRYGDEHEIDLMEYYYATLKRPTA